MALPNEVTQLPDPMTILKQGQDKTADLQAKQAAAETDIKARQAAETAPVQQARDTAGTDLGKMLDKGPDQVALPKNEAQHMDPKQLSDHAGMMMALAGLAGAMIRAPITVALRGMTGAMQGAQAADEKQFNEGYAKYKDNLNEALKLNDEKLKDYDRVLKGKEFNVREMDAQLRNIAKKYGDEGIANARDFKTMFDSVNGQTKAMMDVRKHQDTMQHQVDQLRQQWEIHKNKAAGSPGGGLSSDAIDALAKRVMAGDKTALQNLGRGTQGARDIVAVQNHLAELQKTGGADPHSIAKAQADVSAASAGLRSLAQRSAKIDAAAIELDKFADNALASVKNVHRGDVTPLNALWRKVELGTGSPEEVDLITKTKALVGAYAGVIGRGSTTVHSLEEAQAVIGPSYAQLPFEAMVKALKQEAKAVKESSREAAESIKNESFGGGGSKPAPSKISSDAEYNSLPSGAEFIAPDGSHRKKP